MPSNNKNRNNGSKNDETKVYKTKHSENKRPVAKKKQMKPDEKQKKGKKNKKGKSSEGKHPKLMMAIKIFIILILLLCVIGAGVVAGIVFGLFGDDFEISQDELKIAAANSVVVDQNGAVIANLSGDEKRKVVTLEEMSPYLPKAYIAIEDERFYQHHGVDIKRTAGAILHTLLGNSSYGGSTITQQLVKNITKEDETQGLAGIMRKVKEWAKAFQVERMISKDQILELYLNILYVGSNSNLHGVELGAEYYFNKSAKDLDLAECAFMAGINHSPNSYDPFDEATDNSQKIKDRTITVLDKMLELGFISQEEHDSAANEVREGLHFSKGAMPTSNYSYHTDAVLEQVIQQVMEERNISRELAQNYVYSSGLTIYSTVDPSIQSRIEEETAKEKYQLAGRDKNKDGTLKNDHTQAAFVIIDPKTGNVLGVSGGLGEKQAGNLNRATQTRRQPGSSIKPLADIAPALQEKVITASTVYDDVFTDFGGDYTPKNDGSDYDGLLGIRDIIARSKNVPEVKIMRELTPQKSIKYLKEFGVSSLVTAEDNPAKNDENLSLAIGGVTNGISPLEMAAGYAAIANGGEYITPTFYTKVVDADGNTVLTPKQERTRVISEQNAYIEQSILQEPVKNSSGTATYCAIKGIDVAAKTGTTDNSYDRWLCGFTPYYAAACWFGYDNQEEVRYNGTNPAGQIWDAIMTDIHKDLQSATFTEPSGIVRQKVCRVTGGLATSSCSNTYDEIFTQDNLPDKCEGHGSQQICSESGKIATPYCSQYCEVKTNYFGSVIPKEQLGLWKAVNGSTSSGTKITQTCTLHTEPKEEEQPKENTTTGGNTTNTVNTNNSTSGGNTTTKPSTNTSGNSTSNTNTTGNTTNTNKPSSGTNTNTNTNADTDTVREN